MTPPITAQIAIIGLGYGGLPLAVEFGNKYSVIGFDISQPIIDAYNQHTDPAGEISQESLKSAVRPGGARAHNRSSPSRQRRLSDHCRTRCASSRFSITKPSSFVSAPIAISSGGGLPSQTRRVFAHLEHSQLLPLYSPVRTPATSTTFICTPWGSSSIRYGSETISLLHSPRVRTSAHCP
jgi:hypothetical protein